VLSDEQKTAKNNFKKWGIQNLTEERKKTPRFELKPQQGYQYMSQMVDNMPLVVLVAFNSIYLQQYESKEPPF
jgi:hypothetical protein